jgi:UDP-N-acetylglucosamine:LPS N-acetylglucosamine transferase
MRNRISQRRLRVLAVASGGGHWVQLQRLAPAFQGTDLHYATSGTARATQVAPAPLFHYADANARTPFQLLKAVLGLAAIVARVRPDVIVSTGAAGGVISIIFGRVMGARCLFIDSVANASRLSLSAALLRRVATVVSQWPDVAKEAGVDHMGSVLEGTVQ